MAEGAPRELRRIAELLREQAAEDRVRLTLHAHQELAEEGISYNAMREALLDCHVLENYPSHQRGPCCLVCGQAADGRPLHLVCTTGLGVIVVITVYEPKPPKWATPFQRGGTA